MILKMPTTPGSILETLGSFCCHDNLEAFRRQKDRGDGDFAVPAVLNKGDGSWTQ